jgi:L-rhamnose-H+ transport protein
MVATFSGIMSACFSFALTAGAPIGEASAAAGTSTLWTGLPKLVVVLLGGFTTNFIWCAMLNIKNRTAYQYLASHVRGGTRRSDGVRRGTWRRCRRGWRRWPTWKSRGSATTSSPRWRARVGTFSSFSTRWARRRWANSASLRGRCTWRASSSSARCGAGFSTSGRGRAGRPTASSPAGIALLILSTIIIGYGTYLKGAAGHH